MLDRRKPILCEPFAFESLASDNEQSGHPALNAGRHTLGGVIYKSAGASNVNLKGDLGDSGREIDFVALLGCNATNATTAQFKLGTTPANAAAGASYDSGAQVIRSPVPTVERLDGLSHWFWELPAAVSGTAARYCQLDIGSHTGDFSASMLIVGKKIEAERFYNRDYQFGADDLGSLDINEWGVPEDSGGLVRKSIEFALGWESEDKFEQEFRPLMEGRGQRKPIYCCFDPAATGYRQARTYIGFLKRALVARPIEKPRTYTKAFSLASIL